MILFLFQRSSKSLCILNVGQNELRDDGILELKEAMQQNRTLLRLGIQATQITCQGAISVAEWVADNPTIQVSTNIKLLKLFY